MQGIIEFFEILQLVKLQIIIEFLLFQVFEFVSIGWLLLLPVRYGLDLRGEGRLHRYAAAVPGQVQ